MLSRIRLPRPSYRLRALRGDVLGGVTAAVVGLPVALAFGLAAGLGPAAGIYGAISVGFFAAVFGGTRSLISGPTGSMTVAMAVIVAAHADNIAEALYHRNHAGLIQIIFGLLRIGRFVTYTPYSVISGFMTGVGVIIILVQILPFLGAPAAAGGPSAHCKPPGRGGTLDGGALIIAAATLAVAIFWPMRFDRLFPSTLAALLVGTHWAWCGSRTHHHRAVPTVLPTFQLPDFSPGILASSIEPALVIALVGSVDTLLTALVEIR